jgi:hypothetical protein
VWREGKPHMERGMFDKSNSYVSPLAVATPKDNTRVKKSSLLMLFP